MFLLGLSAFVGSALLAGVVGIALLAKHDRGQPVFTFGLFVLVVGFWSATYAGYLLSSTPEWLLRFVQLSYLSVVSVPVVWFVFAIQYTDRSDWLSRRRIALLAVVPTLVIILVFTAQSHSFFYTKIATKTVDGVQLLETSGGIGHRINILYAYGTLVVGSGLIIGELFTNNQLYRRQSLVVVACLIAPWAANAVFHLGVQPVPTADLTPVVFVLSSLPLAVIVQRTELTGFVPIAHERIFHTLNDPVFVITSSNRILDANRAADSLVDAGGDSIRGREIAAILPEALLDGGKLHPGLATEMECVIEVNGTPREYIARLRATDPARQDPRGCLLSLTDITAQKTRQANLERKNEQLERLASVASHDLATPLATGETLLHLIRTDIVDPPSEVRQSLSDLETVHGRLRTFAEGLPVLARESTDVSTPTDCDLETVLRSAWRVVDTADLRLDVRETCSLTADPNRLQQAFENLIQNSVDHGHAADDDVSTVTAGRLSPTQGFYIEDDGPGIPPNRREDIVAFGVSTGTGSGYGLAIVQSTVEAHGWTLSVTESPTGGARFEINTESFERPEHSIE